MIDSLGGFCYTGCNDVLSYVDAHISCMHVCVCEDMCLDAHTYLYKSVYTFFLRYYIYIYIIYIYIYIYIYEFMYKDEYGDYAVTTLSLQHLVPVL